MLGKINSEWKVWTLDDNGRIEVPLNSEHCETFPIGVSIDISSVHPVGMPFVSYLLYDHSFRY